MAASWHAGRCCISAARRRWRRLKLSTSGGASGRSGSARWPCGGRRVAGASRERGCGMAYRYVLYEKRGRIAYVTINRPEVMNAVHRDANAELTEVFDDFKGDDDAWIAIVTGAG